MSSAAILFRNKTCSITEVLMRGCCAIFQGYFDRGCWIRQVVLYRQVGHNEDKHDVKIDISKGNVDKTSELGHKCNVENETYEASPCKKSKLAIEYSDSEEEDSNEVEQSGEILDSRKNNEGIRKGTLGQNEYNKGIKEISIVVKHEDKKILNKEVEDKDTCDGDRGGLRSNKVISEDTRNAVVEDTEGCRRTVSGCTEGCERTEKDDTEECKRTVIDYKEGYEGAIVDNIKGCKRTVVDEREMIDEERRVDNCNRKQDENVSVPVQKEDEHSSQPVCDEKPEEKKDILQMYEERATIFTDSDEKDERKMNDEDLFDESSSEGDDEDAENDPDDVSTEFVSISEIDFNLYP